MPRGKKAPEAETAAKAEGAVKTEPAPKAKRTPKTPGEAIKRTVARKTRPAVKTYVEYQGKQVDADGLAAAVQESWTGGAIQSLDLYVKPEDGAVYYVVNGTDKGSMEF